MAKSSWLLSCTTLISLSGAFPGTALDISQQDVAALRDHWRECHPEMPVPADRRLVRGHGPLYDEDHFELFMESVRAHSCDDDMVAAVNAPTTGTPLTTAAAASAVLGSTEIEE